ncbi:MAG: hypothetical protein RLZZ67_643 [Candidatus Parcubacteria bacterium]|jgi:uncharacterized membrane protein
MNTLLYIYTILSLAVIDAVWLFSTGAQYKKWLGHLFADTVNFVPAIIFYLIYTFGVVFFVVSPAVKNSTGLLTVLLSGAILGLVAYGTYDLTNHATMRDWPLVVTLLDMAWGALLTGTASVIAVSIYRYFN